MFGFLATVMFIADLVVFVKNDGFPFKKDAKPQSSNGGPATAEAPPETEKLNAAE